MEVIAITTTHILTRLANGKTSLIRAQDIDENHPIITDKLSYRLGVVAGMNNQSANDKGMDVNGI